MITGDDTKGLDYIEFVRARLMRRRMNDFRLRRVKTVRKWKHIPEPKHVFIYKEETVKDARKDKRKESGQGHMKRMTAREGKEINIK